MTAPGVFEPDLTLWEAWTPFEVSRRFAGVRAPWCVAAGWAIDLFLGGQRREHGDLEVAVPRDRFGEVLAALDGFELFVPVGGSGNGLVWPLDQAGDHFESLHQTWVREPETGYWRLDIFREPADGDTWVFRRDERIRLPYRDVIERTEDGIPYLCPEMNLLFKAKWADLEKNQSDFAAVLPKLDGPRRRWLADALALVHPGHPWLSALGE